MRKRAEPTPTPRAVRSRAPKRSSPTHEDIARRAYELFVARGRTAGLESEDWLRAERELLERAATTVTRRTAADRSVRDVR